MGADRGRRGRPRLYGIQEIANSLGVGDGRLVATWRRRGSHGMPEPDADLASGSVWLAETIEPWIARERARRATGPSRNAPDTGALVRRLARRVFRLASVVYEDRWRGGTIYRRGAEVAELEAEIRGLAAGDAPGRPEHAVAVLRLGAGVAEVGRLIEAIPAGLRGSRAPLTLPPEALGAVERLRELVRSELLPGLVEALRTEGP